MLIQVSTKLTLGGGVTNDVKKEIKDITTFSKGNLPFRYPGIPLSSKKLKVQQCIILVDKIIGRIRH